MTAMDKYNLSEVSEDEAPPKDGVEEEMKVEEHKNTMKRRKREERKKETGEGSQTGVQRDGKVKP